MKKVILTILAVMAIGVMGCKKDDDKTTSFPLTIYAYYREATAKAVFGSNETTLKAPNITVTLYKSSDDLRQQKNQVASGVTNAEGVVNFDNLEGGVYYVEASNDRCFSNISDIEQYKNEIGYIKGVEKSFSINIDKISAIDVNNYLNKDVYVSIDNDPIKILVKEGKTVSGYVTPLIGATLVNYLKHTIKLYNNSLDIIPFKEMEITVDDKCDVRPIDLRTNKRNITFVFKDEQQNRLGEREVAVRFNGQNIFTNNIGEATFEITDMMSNDISLEASTSCDYKYQSINPYLYKAQNNYVTITIRRPVGTIMLKNISSNPYTVTIGSEQYVVEGGATKTIETSLGSKNINVRQKSGYILYPTVKDYTGTVTCDEILTVTFP